jgi:hypothetical protein
VGFTGLLEAGHIVAAGFQGSWKRLCRLRLCDLGLRRSFFPFTG